MATATTTPRPSYLDALEPILTEIIAPAAGEIDRTATYPQAALDALARAGLLGLVSAKEVGGLGEGIRAATLVVEQIEGLRPSTGGAARITSPGPPTSLALTSPSSPA